MALTSWVMHANAEHVQSVLGSVVCAEQRLAWAKMMTRLGAAAGIQDLLRTEHGRGLPRLVGELLLTTPVSELIIARTEMQVCMRRIHACAVPQTCSGDLPYRPLCNSAM